MEESKGNIKQKNIAPLSLTKLKSIVLYFQDNLVLIQTNSDHLFSKKTHTQAEVPNTFWMVEIPLVLMELWQWSEQLPKMI